MARAGDQVGIAVIGCGQWGFNHIRVFSGLPESRVVASADVAQERLQRVRQTFPAVRLEQDYRRVLESTEIDAVVIATPASTHYDLAAAAMERGKHVLCEKPMCVTVGQALQLVEVARRRDRVLMVGHVFLFNPGIVKLKKLIDEGELGTLYHCSAIRANLGPIRSDVNAAYDLAAHDVSIYNWLLGSVPEVVSATGASFLQPNVEDVVFISLQYQGVLAHVHASWLSPKKIRQITGVGSRRMVTWDDLEPSAPIAIFDKGATANVEYQDFGQFLRLSMWEGDVRLPKVPTEEPLRAQNRHFLEGVQRGDLDRSDGEFGLGVVRTLEAVAQSLAERGVPARVTA